MIVIIDYDAGNLRSVQRACEKVGLTSEISSDPDRILRAEKIIFPGVGSAESAMETLKKRGLDNAIVDFSRSGKPILGICLGLQILLDHTEEGDKKCLGMVHGACEHITGWGLGHGQAMCACLCSGRGKGRARQRRGARGGARGRAPTHGSACSA